MEEYLLALIKGAVSWPVAWGRLNSGTETPRASLFRVSGVQDSTLDGIGPLEARVQVSCFGKSYAEAVGAAREVRELLSGYRGGPIMGAFLDRFQDGSQEDVDVLNSVILTFVIHYTE